MAGGGMTFILGTYGAGILPSRLVAERIDPGSQLSQINTSLNIVHTKHWLFNEIPEAVFHPASLDKCLSCFISLPFQPQEPLNPREAAANIEVNISVHLLATRGYSNLWCLRTLSLLYATMLNTKLP